MLTFLDPVVGAVRGETTTAEAPTPSSSRPRVFGGRLAAEPAVSDNRRGMAARVPRRYCCCGRRLAPLVLAGACGDDRVVGGCVRRVDARPEREDTYPQSPEKRNRDGE